VATKYSSDERPTGVRWTVFGLACTTSWLLYLHRYIFALIKPSLAKEWDLGNDELGYLDSAFSLFYSGMQIPLGIAIDCAGVHLLLTSMIVLWSLGLGLHGWAPSLREMWFARVTFGIGQAGVYAALSRLTRTWMPSNVRTTLQGWVVSSGRFGGLTANLLVGTLMLGIFAIPWRTAVFIMAGLGLAHALTFALLFRNSPRSHPGVNDAEADLIAETTDSKTTAPPPKKSAKQMFREMDAKSIGNMLLVNTQTILSTFADNIFSAWIPLFLFQVHKLEFREMGIYSSLPLLGGALGGITGGFLHDKLATRLNRRWARSAIGFAGKGLAGAMLLFALLFYDQPRVFCGILFFVKFFSDWSLTMTWGVVTDIGGRASASVFAFNNSIAGLGAIIAPSVYGNLSEHSGWMPVFWTAAAVYFACAASWLGINCMRPLFNDDDQE
jgi:sugar phosphate permease